MNEPIITVRIQNDERVVASSAFPLELLAIVAGLKIASKRPGLRKIVTDCEAALKLLSSPEKLDYWGNKAIALNAGEGNIEHAHSHPESRLHKKRWTRNDNGNFIANRV